MVNYEGVALEKRTKFIVSNVIDEKHTDLSILDIGCGNGSISSYLGALGYNVTGIDLDVNTVLECDRQNRFSNVKPEINI